MAEVVVRASKSYHVIIDEGIIKLTGEIARNYCEGSKSLVVCGDNVDKLYAECVCKSLKASGFQVYKFVYPHGEKSKNSKIYLELIEACVKARLDRHDFLVALGGGVTGDLTGFAASTYMRGISYLQIPTTLLAMVDSSVGGKTGINLPEGKNLVGTFWQPNAVVCDYTTLKTLPTKFISEGYAEIIKYAVISDPELLELLYDADENIDNIILRCVQIKRNFVEADEKDKSLRMKLNFGHTVGHAIESLSNYTIPHGQAVAIGMSVISRATAAKSLCSYNVPNEICAALEKYNLPVKTKYTAEQISEAITNDKKKGYNAVSLIIPVRIGECKIKEIPFSELENFISLGL